MCIVPSGRLLLVAPHFDDAALSCAALLESAEPVDVLTVFGGAPQPPQTGPWDLITGFPSSAVSVPTRAREEMAAFAGSHHRVRTLDLLELQYVHEPRPPREAGQIGSALTEWLERNRPATVALPAGAGRRRGRLRTKLEAKVRPVGGPLEHPDHLFVRDSGLACLAGPAHARLLLYEELPYRWGARGDRAAVAAARSVGLRARRVDVPVDRSAKAARIAAYPTQVPHLMPSRGRLDDARRLPKTERYWWLEP